MGGLFAIWQLIPASMQPFFISGPCGFLFFGWFFFTMRSKKNAEDMEHEAWEIKKTAALRIENDHKSLRVTELEEHISSLRRSFENTIDRIRSECAIELVEISRDRTRGWDLARAWYDVSYRLWYMLASTTQDVPEDKRKPIPEPIGRFEDRAGITSDKSPIK